MKIIVVAGDAYDYVVTECMYYRYVSIVSSSSMSPVFTWHFGPRLVILLKPHFCSTSDGVETRLKLTLIPGGSTCKQALCVCVRTTS